MVYSTLVSNCAITPDGVTAAAKIHFPNIQYLKGNTLSKKSIPLAVDYIALPLEIFNEHGDVTVFIDVKFTICVP